MSWGWFTLWDCYKSPHGLEPLTAVREMEHWDPVFSYFLLREGEEGPWQEWWIQTQGGVQRYTVIRVQSNIWSLMKSKWEEMKHTRRLRRHGPKHRTAPIAAMGPRRGKSHKNQPPSQLLGFHTSQVCTGTWVIFLLSVAMFVTLVCCHQFEGSSLNGWICHICLLPQLEDSLSPGSFDI
jgi:hypothetical protein